MPGDQARHLVKLPLDAIKECVVAEPKVKYTENEMAEVLKDLYKAVDDRNYVQPTPTVDNPALSDDYVFDTEDEIFILKDLKKENFVGKIKDLSKGALRRRENGLPDEFLYVFQYACTLYRRDAITSNEQSENILIYIKINNRKIPYEKVFVISFHKNKTKE